MFNTNHNFAPVPHHQPLVPHDTMGPAGRHNVISILYDGDKLQEVFGDLWGYHVEKIAPEPPEMKFLFALEMGFHVTANKQIIEALLHQREKERATGITTHKFANAALTDEVLQILSSKLGIEKDIVSVVLEHAPDGVVSIIIAVATNNE